MSDDHDVPRFPLPSEFMRARRPELYSDSSAHTSFHLDRAVFSHHLETITERNEHQSFELFCRKLCEREICPNLRPQTGPEGGGDGKADTETYPVAEEVSLLWYVGEANARSERWAFAFSAKKKWTEKVRSDVAGIAETNRDYKRIIFVTSRPARSQDRLRIEDELTKKCGIPVTIHDRSWIIEKVYEHEHFGLAIEYLNIPHSTSETRADGPDDLRRQSDLDGLETLIQDPTGYEGVEYQRVEDALVAAKISRNLERPPYETEGRFQRAIQLAERHGFGRQLLRATYEYAWTVFWWFDDFQSLTKAYKSVENLALSSDKAIDIELLCNLFTVLNSSVSHKQIDEAAANLSERRERIEAALRKLAAEDHRPNNALQAETSLTLLQLLRDGREEVDTPFGAYWDKFNSILDRAQKLAEYPVEQLLRLNEVFGMIAGDDPAYDQFVERLAEVAAQRQSDGKSGEILLARGKEKLDLERPVDAINLLGRAALKFLKHEYRDQQIEAQYLIAVGYSGAGLRWASRSACLMALFSIIADAQENDEFRVEIIPTLKLWCQKAIELGHLPDILCTIELLSAFGQVLPLDEPSREHVANDRKNLEMSLACMLLNASEDTLRDIPTVPDILEALQLPTARLALLYRLGHEATLREEQWIPLEESPEDSYAMMFSIANQPLFYQTPRDLLTFARSTETLDTVVVGVNIAITFENSDVGAALAEALVSSIEAFLATSLNNTIIPHASSAHIAVLEVDGLSAPEHKMHPDQYKAEIRWPKGFHLNDRVGDNAPQDFLFEFMAHFVACIAVVPSFERFERSLFQTERAPDRALSFSPPSICYSRIMGRSRSTLADWAQHVNKEFQLLADHPTFDVNPEHPDDLSSQGDEARAETSTARRTEINRHTDIKVDAIINLPLWNKAGWRGVAYLGCGDQWPPVLGLIFENTEVSEEIFRQWFERFGPEGSDRHLRVSIVRGVSKRHPAHYRICLSPELPDTPSKGDDRAIRIGLSRVHTMEAETTQNLDRFLSAYKDQGSYFFAAVKAATTGIPPILSEYVFKRVRLSIVEAWQVDVNSSEAAAIFEDDDIVIPEGTRDAPVQAVIEMKKELQKRRSF